MPFDLENLNPVSRFYWDEDDHKADEEREWVEIVVVPDAEMNNMRKAVGIKTKTKFMNNPTTKRMERVDDLNLSDDVLEKLNEKIVDYQIVNWHFVTPTGEDIPCTFENKKKMVYGSPKFSNWLTKCITDLESSVKVIKEEELGN